jgi:hypothetical protein
LGGRFGSVSNQALGRDTADGSWSRATAVPHATQNSDVGPSAALHARHRRGGASVLVMAAP